MIQAENLTILCHSHIADKLPARKPPFLAMYMVNTLPGDSALCRVPSWVVVKERPDAFSRRLALSVATLAAGGIALAGWSDVTEVTDEIRNRGIQLTS